ncbi:MAG: methyltransferase [Chloroflexota bacterium]
MPYIAIGCLSFVVLHFFDFFALRKTPAAKPLTWIFGSGLLIYAVVIVSLSPEKIPLPVWSVWLGWILFAVSAFLLFYSLFVNLPLYKTYLSTGVSDKLVRTGMYALVRHPGVHWLSLTLVSLILVTQSRLLFVATPIFIVLDIALVILQDRFFFVRMFAEYTNYQRETPMLVPTRQSLHAFITSLKSQSKYVDLVERRQ